MVIFPNSESLEEKKNDLPIGRLLKNLLPRVFRTEGDVVPFDPLKIEKSIITETGLDHSSANKITEMVVRRIISSGIKFLSGPHIREIVCSILSEQHFEEERKIYTRIGMPLMDYEAILEKGVNENVNHDMNPENIHHWAANKISDEYALLRILDSEEAHAHLFGDLHIDMLRYFDLRPFCHEWDPRMVLEHGLPPIDSWNHCGKSGPAGSLRVAVTHLAKWLGMIQGEFSGGQGFDYINVFLAPYARGLSNREIEQSMQCLVYEINQVFAARGGLAPFTSISCAPTIPDSLLNIPAIGPYSKIVGKYGDYKEECLKLFNALTEVYIQGDHNKKSFSIPIHEIKIKKEWLKEFESSYLMLMEEIIKKGNPSFLNMCPEWIFDEIHSQSCRKILNNHQILNPFKSDLGESEGKSVWENYVSIGSLQSVTLNLPRYAYLSSNKEDYFEILDEKIELAVAILNKKWELMEKRRVTGHLPLCSGKIKGKAIFNLKDQNLSIGFIGLNEAVHSLSGSELHENYDSYSLGKKILEYMVAKCKIMTERDGRSYSLWQQSSKSTSTRLAMLDLKHFPKKAIVQPNGTSANYTNSNHLHYENNLLKYVKEQGDFHPIIKGGVITHILLKNEKLNKENLWKLTKNICLNSNTVCFSFQ